LEKLDSFGGMTFKKYWSGGVEKGAAPQKRGDYIFVRKRDGGQSPKFEVWGLESKVGIDAELTQSQGGKGLAALQNRPARQPLGLRAVLCRFALGLTIALTSCHIAPMGPVNLQEKGWQVREGQAVWKRNKTAPEIAGDVLVATRGDGRSFVQFTKTPFPMIIAQTTTNRWQIEIPMQNKRYSGPGSPPKRLIWAYLPRLLAGDRAPKGWSWTRLPDNGWRLENARSGEVLQGYVSTSAQ
jgi:hypothetical protein